MPAAGHGATAHQQSGRTENHPATVRLWKAGASRMENHPRYTMERSKHQGKIPDCSPRQGEKKRQGNKLTSCRPKY